ncbi:MAG: thioredoxin family protein [Archangium sp.]
MNSAPLVLVEFGGTWCPPCKALKPVLEAMSSERPEVPVLYVDVDESQVVTQRFGVRSIPTLIAFRNGKATGQIIGAVPRPKIEALLSHG